MFSKSDAVPGSDNRRLVEELRLQLAYYRSLIEASLDPLVTIAPNGKITDVNKATERTTGIARKELIDTDFSDYFTEPQKARQGYKKVFSKGFVKDYPLTIKHKDGSETPVLYNASVYKRKDDEATGVFTTARDITKQKKMEAEIGRLSIAVEQSYNSIIITDLAGDIVFINKAFERITGYSREEVLKKNPRILKSDHHPPVVYEELWQTISSGGVWRGEFYNKRKDGSYYWENAVISPLKDSEGKIINYLAIKEDITSRKITEEKFKTTKTEAEAASRYKSEFLANMSHEIRTPLNAILGFNQILLAEEDNPDKAQKLEIIQRSGRTLLGLINDILDLSKIESGKLEIEELYFNPHEEFSSTVELFHQKAIEKNIVLLYFIDPKLPLKVKGDRLRIKQVLLNLVGNSLKFTPRGGSIYIEIIKSGCADSSCRLLFSVTDTGIGIPENKKALIFEAFSQADTSITRKFGGTGLGLAISINLVKQMGGSLKMESEEGKGSKFYFELELKTDKNTKSMTTAVELEGLKIGIYQPEPENWLRDEIIKKYLSSFGLEVREINDLSRVEDVDSLNAFFFTCSSITKEELLAHMERLKSVPCILIAYLNESKKAAELGKYFTRIIYCPFSGSQLADTLKEVTDSSESGSKEVIEIEEKEVASSPSLALPSALANAQVLVAEDNDINQMLMRSLLEKYGIEADMAGNGLEALSRLKEKDYDLILMDINMPELDGIETAKRIVEEEIRKGKTHTPIVALTAHALKGAEQKFLEAGMDDYVSKPIDLENLKRVLHKYLESERNEPEATISIEAISQSLQLELPVIMKLLAGFKRNAAANLVKMEETASTGEYEQLTQLAHKLKGSAANMRIKPIAEAAAAIESFAQDAKEADYKKLIGDIRETLINLEQQLEQSDR